MSAVAATSSKRPVDRRTLLEPVQYDTDDLTEVNTNKVLLTSSTSKRTVRVCTMCGRYRGLRSVPKSSRPSFHL